MAQHQRKMKTKRSGGSVEPDVPVTRNFQTVFLQLSQYYTSADTLLVGDFSVDCDVYIAFRDANRAVLSIISGYTDANNYFDIGADVTGKLTVKIMAGGVLTTCTSIPVFVSREMKSFKVNRVGSTLSIDTMGYLQTFTVPTSDVLINRFCTFNLTQYMSGTFKSLIITDSVGTKFNLDFSNDFSGGFTVPNAGAAGNLTAVNMTAFNITPLTYNPSTWTWENPSINYWTVGGWTLDGVALNATKNQSSSATAETAADGVFNQRITIDSNTTTGNCRFIYGLGQSTIFAGTPYNNLYVTSANSRRLQLQNLTTGNTGSLSAPVVTPVMQSEDPRDLYTVVHIGDSITNYMMSGNNDYYKTKAGDVRLDVFNEGVGGNTIQQMATRLPGILATHANKARLLFVIMAGSNQEDPLDLDAYDAVLRGMVTDIFAAGHQAAIMNRTASVSTTTIEDEPDVNTLHNNVICEELTPHWFNSATGRPYLDGYVWMMNGQNQSPSWFIDNLHPSDTGELILIDNVAPIIAERIQTLFA